MAIPTNAEEPDSIKPTSSSLIPIDNPFTAEETGPETLLMTTNQIASLSYVVLMKKQEWKTIQKFIEF